MADPRRRRAARRAVTGAAVLGGVGVTGATALATLVARRVVAPADGEYPDDVRILAVDDRADPPTVTLEATDETRARGRYGLWLPGGGHARVGEPVAGRGDADVVVRHLIATDRGRLVPGPARWNQYYFAGTPESALGLAYDDVTIAGDSGPLPAWFVPAAGDVGPSATWAVLVHGRGASREEGLRAVPVLRRLGIASLVIGYRNDVDALRSPSGRYHLGASEWRDVEAAVLHAVRCGAERIVLVGWSMGGAITLQLLDRSWLADRVVCAVLDAPVISWRDVLDHHARVNRLPRAVGRLAQGLLDHGHGRRLAALEMPLGLDSMDWVTRAGDLRTPLLVLHSDDDDFVPSGPSRALAERRPELVTFAPSRGARHTKEWNVDPTGWETTVETYLRRWVPTASAPSGSVADGRPPESSVADL